MKVVKFTSSCTINGIEYKKSDTLRVCSELFTDLVEKQKCAIKHTEKVKPKKSKGE